jgi:H+/gluconate symporter-like permease
MQAFGVIGLLVSLAFLIYFVFKGFGALPVAIAASLIAIITNNVGIWQGLSEGFAVSMRNYVGNYLIIFFLGAVIGEIISKSGAAKRIAITLARAFGAKNCILIIVLISALLTYGGVSVFVVIFSVYPIALNLLKEADVPQRLLPGYINLGAGTFTMTCLPGTPALTNVIPTQFLGTTVTAAPVLGLCAAAVMFVAGMIIQTRYTKAVKAKGEHFVARPGEDIRELSADEIAKLPGFITSLVPLLLVIVIIIGERLLPLEKHLPSSFAVIIGLFSGIVVGYALLWTKIEDKRAVLNAGGAGSIQALMNTASVVGFGGAIRFVPAFAAFTALATSIKFAPVVSAALAVNVIAGITGSSSAGVTIFMESMGKQFLATGINPQVLHRIASIGAGVLDSLPHAGPNVTFLAVTKLTFKEGYFGIFLSTCVVPAIGLTAAIILSLFGIV